MKKILILVLFTAYVAAVSARKPNESPYKFFAQTSGMNISSGGDMDFITGYNKYKENGLCTREWGVSPGFGWMITDNFWVAMGVGYKESKITTIGETRSKQRFIGINPYVCQVVFTQGDFGIFLMLEGTYGHTKVKGLGSGDTWGIGFYPVASYSFTDRLSINAAIAGISYKDYDGATSFDFTAIGMTGLSFSLCYSFGRR